MVRRNIRAVERLAGGGGGGLAATPVTALHLSLTHQLNTQRSCSPDWSAVAAAVARPVPDHCKPVYLTCDPV